MKHREIVEKALHESEVETAQTFFVFIFIMFGLPVLLNFLYIEGLGFWVIIKWLFGLLP